MAITLFEKAIDEQIAKAQKEQNLEVTVDLNKPIINEQERRQKNIENQLKQKVKTDNGTKPPIELMK